MGFANAKQPRQFVGAVVAALSALACTKPTEPDVSRVAWYRADSRGSQNIPLVDGDQAVFTAFLAPAVVAIELASGTLRWERLLSAPGGSQGFGIPADGSAVAAAGMVIVPAGDVFAMDRVSGNTRWVFSKNDDFPGSGKLLVRGNRVFTVGRRLYAIDVRTGTQLWERPMEDRAADPVGGGVGRILVFSRQLIPGTGTLGPAWLHALAEEDGREIWRVLISRPGVAISAQARPPFVKDGLVIVATHDGRILAIREEDGSTVWTHTRPTDLLAGAVVLGQTVVTTGADGRIVGLDLTSGAQRWSALFGLSGGSVLTPLTVGANAIYGVAGRAVAYSEDGTLLWGFGGEGLGEPPFLSSATEAGQLLLVGGTDGFYAVRLDR